MLQIIAGSWPIAVMFIAALGALLGLRVMSLVQKNREEDRAYRASQARNVTTTGMILIALCAVSLLVHVGSAIAADLPVIGKSSIGQTAAHRRLVKECAKDVPAHETQKQFERRLNLPCPGRLE